MQNPTKTEEPKAFSVETWTEKANHYEKKYDPVTLPNALALANMIDIQNSKDILEIACATGEFTLHMLRNLKGKKTYTSCDIAEGMIARADERKQELEGINKSIKHEFRVANADNLDFIKDESIDTYLSFLCIHLVPDKEKFLSEAFRVLRKGGRIGLTVPKRQDSLFPLIFDTLAAHGAKAFEGDGPFILGNNETFIKLLQDIGFEVEYCWNDQFKYPCHNEQYIDNLLEDRKDFGNLYFKLDEEQRKQVRDTIVTEFWRMKKEYHPLHTLTVSIIGRKPL